MKRTHRAQIHQLKPTVYIEAVPELARERQRVSDGTADRKHAIVYCRALRLRSAPR